MNKIIKYLKKPSLLYLNLSGKGFFKWVPDDIQLKRLYRITMGKKLNLSEPRTFNEKLQWLKLNDRKDIYTTMVDKYEVKKYVASIIGEEYIIPTIGIYNTFDEIDFEKLPNQFVIKCTHDSGGIVICKDKSKLDINAAKKTINKYLKRKYYYVWREWPYKNVKPRIIIEKYMEDNNTKVLDDYKFFCFNGEPEIMFIATDRQNKDKETCFDFFDMNYNHLNIINGHPNATVLPKKPKNFEKMKELSRALSKNIPHLRIDFYEIDGKVYFGELTFSHWGGFVHFEPEEWDYKLGDMIKIQTKK